MADSPMNKIMCLIDLRYVRVGFYVKTKHSLINC